MRGLAEHPICRWANGGSQNSHDMLAPGDPGGHGHSGVLIPVFCVSIYEKEQVTEKILEAGERGILGSLPLTAYGQGPSPV